MVKIWKLLSNPNAQLFEKFPNLQFKKKLGFNTFGETVKFAFNIDEEILKKINKKNSITLNNFIDKYGKELGTEKFNNYREKQKISNTYEYKKDKYDWTKEQFDEFNISRGITLENLIKKYGNELGTEKFKIYCERQKYTNSIEYSIEKYGEIEGKINWLSLNKSKALTIKNFINKYGDTEGAKKYKEYILKISSNAKLKYSAISQEFFNKIDNYFNKKYTTYYATKNKEYGKYINNLNSYVMLDFFIKELNLAIEFQGDIFHANPKIFKASDNPNPFRKDLSSSEIWEKDKKRKDLIKKEHNIEIIYVWESDYILNKESKHLEIIQYIYNNYETIQI